MKTLANKRRAIRDSSKGGMGAVKPAAARRNRSAASLTRRADAPRSPRVLLVLVSCHLMLPACRPVFCTLSGVIFVMAADAGQMPHS
jgi:hypothetical protein